MAYSYQEAISDGTLRMLGLSISYIREDELSVLVNGSPAVGWSVVGTEVVFDSPVPAGAVVRVQRNTPAVAPYHTFGAGAAFTAAALDENLLQVHHIAQEAYEGARGDYDNVRGDLATPAGASLVGAVVGGEASTVQAALNAGVGVGNVVLLVPAQYATVQAALTAASGMRISPGGSITIQVSDGTYAMGATKLSLNHPQGAQVKLLGNVSNPAACVLAWDAVPAGHDAIALSGGHTFGLLDGFEVRRPAHAGTVGTGVLAASGSTLHCGEHMRVVGFYYSVAARDGSYVSAPSVYSEGAGDVGLWAFCGSFLACPGATVYSASDPALDLGYGIQAEYGSTVECSGAFVSGCRVAGVAALSGSTVRAHGVESTANVGSGAVARDGGVVELHGATLTANGQYGWEQFSGGLVRGNSVLATSNGAGVSNSPAELNADPALGARLHATAGNLRLDAEGANSIYCHTSGGVQFEAAHSAGSSSWIRANGSASGQPALTATGDAASIDANLRGKGSGSVLIGNSADNFLRVAPSAGVVAVTADGPDADLLLSGTGTGKVRWGAHAAGSVTPNGVVEWKLADGATVRVAAQRL